MNDKMRAIVAATLLCGAAVAMAGEKLPENAMLLSDLVKSLEDKGYSPITDVSLDDGVWEVEAYLKQQERELRVDPVTAEIISDRLDD